MSVTVGQDDVELDSPWEALFWGLCRFHEVPVIRNTDAGIEDSHGGWYQPGFHVAVPNIVDVWVEVADGCEDAARRHGRNCWRTFGTRRLVVLYRDDLDALRDAGRPAQFAARLRQTQGRR